MRIVSYRLLLIAGLCASLLIIAIISPLFLRHHPVIPDRLTCKKNIKILGVYVLEYETKHGHFPQSESWIKDITELHSGDKYYEKHYGKVTQFLKCPLDKSGSISSYDFNPQLSGKRIYNIPINKFKSIVLIKEKQFPNSHRWVLYLDLHAEEKKDINPSSQEPGLPTN